MDLIFPFIRQVQNNPEFITDFTLVRRDAFLQHHLLINLFRVAQTRTYSDNH